MGRLSPIKLFTGGGPRTVVAILVSFALFSAASEGAVLSARIAAVQRLTRAPLRAAATIGVEQVMGARGPSIRPNRNCSRQLR